ncbi:MAG: phenylacetate--CoA ligase family protein [Oscillospiraceae bacterium]|nr:phenylacetate--CoA ligase family protein [Oscillospiraceae bacterium]
MRKIGLIKALFLTRKADKMSAAERTALQQERLKELVSYVKENSPYFADLYKNANENTPLSEMPVTNKKEMMVNFDKWLTDSSITKEKVEDFMSDVSNVGTKLDGKYLVYTTSGSTGNPCIMLYDESTINVSSAIGALRSFARKDDMTAFMKSGKKTMALFADGGFYLGCGSVRYNLRKMPWKKKVMRTCDVRKPTDEIVSTLNEYQPSMIGCYPTAMEVLAAEQEQGRLKIKPAIIMTGGEKLNDEVREHLSEVFDCYVQTNYSCTEGGTMACECTERHFHINDDWVILEAVDENNKPVPFGTQSAKVLLTNLANKICPVIRFEITDRIIMHNEPCKCGNTRPWLTIEGRTDDIIFFENGVRIAPMLLYAILKEVHGINRFQLIQHNDDRLELRLIADNKQEIFTVAKKAVEDYLSENGVLTEVFLSDEAPAAHPVSGKYKHIIAKNK